MKRIWEYVLVFFIVMIGTGGYTVLSFNSSLTSTITTDTTISTDADPVFDGTLSRIMQTRDASANYNLNIETESGTINANGDILVKVTDDGFNFDFNFGQTFLTEEEIKNKNYKLVIICGGCMIDKQKYQTRLELLEELKIPTSNYGIIFSYIKNKKILEDTARIFN